MSRGYFQRLVARTGGESAPRVAPAPAPARAAGDMIDPFEAVAPIVETVPHAVPPPPGATERHVRTETVREHVVSSPAIVPSPAIPAAPVSKLEAKPATIEPAPRVVVQPRVDIEPPLHAPIATRELPPLRMPDDRETVVERWLAPAPSPLVPREPAPTPPPPKPLTPSASESAMAAPRPARPIVAPLPITPQPPTSIAAPSAERRPALAIGRLVVEVLPPTPPPAPITTIVKASAPTSTRALPNVLDRGFGLGQS